MQSQEPLCVGKVYGYILDLGYIVKSRHRVEGGSQMLSTSRETSRY